MMIWAKEITTFLGKVFRSELPYQQDPLPSNPILQDASLAPSPCCQKQTCKYASAAASKLSLWWLFYRSIEWQLPNSISVTATLTSSVSTSISQFLHRDRLQPLPGTKVWPMQQCHQLCTKSYNTAFWKQQRKEQKHAQLAAQALTIVCKSQQCSQKNALPAAKEEAAVWAQTKREWFFLEKVTHFFRFLFFFFFFYQQLNDDMKWYDDHAM